MFSTTGLVILVIICLVLWLVFRLLKKIIIILKREFHQSRERMKSEKEERKYLEWEAKVAKTKILSKNRHFISNRKYYNETTFMVFYTNGTHKAITIENGSRIYDSYMSKLVE